MRRARRRLTLTFLGLGRGLVAIGVLSVAPTASAREPSERAPMQINENELAREAEDPVSNLSSIPIQNEVDFGVGRYGRVRNTLSLQPTYALALTRDVAVVSRTRVPIVSEPSVPQPSGYTSGLSDVTESLLVVPQARASSGVLWGVGPTFLLPTATENALGTGKLGLGPVAALLTQPKPWTFGVLAGQIWSVAGAADRPNVSMLSVMPLAVFYFSRGWYVSTSPTITANWNASTARNVWTVPVGGGGGKVVTAPFPMNVSFGVYWNALRPDTAASPSVSVQVQVAFLFPRGAKADGD